MHYDAVVVGAGPGGIFTALNLSKRNEIKKILLIEKGDNYTKRHCRVDHYELCGNCEHCRVMNGFGGCIHCGDSVKLSRYPSGKYLYELIGHKEYENAFLIIKDILVECGADDNFILTNVTNPNVKNYPISVQNSNSIRLLINYLYNLLIKNSKIELLLNTEVIDFNNINNVYEVHVDKSDKSYTCDNLFIAIGRSGMFWWKKKVRDIKLKYNIPTSSIGFRFEMPKEFLSDLGNIHPDFKFRYEYKKRKYKTFCFCGGEDGGRLKLCNYDGVALLDGHILTETDNDSACGNFALLTQLIDDQGNAISYDNIRKYYIENYRKLNIYRPGKPVCQNYYDFANRITVNNNKNSIPSSIYEMAKGNLHELLNNREHDNYCYVSNIVLNCVLSYCGYELSESIMKKINVVGLVVEGLWDQLEINKYMMTSSNNLYVIGDCAGSSQGIVQAMIAGIIAGKYASIG